MLQHYQTIRERFFRFRAKLRWVLLCSATAWMGTHATFPVISKFFSCSKFSVRVCNTSDIHTGQTFAINWSKIQPSWVLMLYYPYKTMFSAYKSDCFSMCLRFICKQSDENHSVHGCPFLAVIFRCFFSVWWLYLEINHSLVAEIICTIYSFIHASTQHNISNKNSFQQCFIFNWSA